MSVTKYLYKKKDGKRSLYYHAQVFFKGKRVAIKNFDTLAAAHTWHDSVKKSWDEGKGDIGGQSDYRFKDLIEDFRAHPRGLLKMRRSSQQSFEIRLPHFTLSPVAKTRMTEFSVTTVDSWFQWILGQPTAQSNKRTTFIAELKILHRLLSWYKNYVQVDFVIPIVERHREDAKFKRHQKRRRDYFIRETDIKPWIEWLKTNYQDPLYYRLATFMLLTGARLGETCGLTWESVDLERGEAHIKSVMCWDQKTRQPYQENDVKTDESNRIIQLPKVVVDMLKEVQVTTGRSSGLVFLAHGGVTPADNKIRNRFDRGFRELNLPWTATRILRHTWGTHARVATSDLNKVQAVMGHTDIKMTQRYAKVAAMLDKSTVEDTAAQMGF